MATLGITGASGQLGTSVLRHLIARNGAGDIVAVTRKPQSVERTFGARVRARTGDFNDEAGLVRAFAGIDRLLLIPGSDLVPGVRPVQHQTAVRAAVAAGVRHLIYVTTVGAKPGPADGILETHFVTEQAVITSGLSWTLIRMSVYADSQIDGLKRAFAAGVHAAIDGAPVSYVVRDDLGRAAAAILATDGHDGITYHATGPESLTQAQLLEAASRGGSQVRFQPLTPAEAAAGLQAAGLPPFLVDVLSRFQRAMHDGAFDLVSGDIERLTGRRAQSAVDFVASALRQ
jgi:NAD(P)H dehydrogenase (quinone)